MFVPKPGLLVGNRYSLTQVIGRGGMGEVWKAHDRQLDAACAVKFIVQHLANDRGIRERFAREAKAVARLRSPHVVQILGVGEVENVPYLAMELLDGETLLSRLSHQSRLPPVVVMKVVEQVAEALESAHHAGIVHRDLKPDNVWFWSGARASSSPSSAKQVFVKVLDFGVAKTGGLTTESLQTATGALVGTPQYMSPEQALGNRDVDHRSDLWSLAVITIECLSGKRPFDSTGLGDLLLKIVAEAPPPLHSFAPELPASLQEWWARALARDPRNRFQSASELAEALRPHLAQLELGGEGPVAQAGRPIASSPITSSPITSSPITSSPITSSPITSSPANSAPARLRESAAQSVRGGATQRPPGTHGGGLVSSARARSMAQAFPPPAATSVHPGAVGPVTGSLGPSAVPAQSAAARSPGSVGPTSSSRHPTSSRAHSRQRTLLIAAALFGAALLVTYGRWLLSRNEEQAQVLIPAPVAAAAPSAGSIALPAPAPKPDGTATAPAQPTGEAGLAPAADSPWDQALRRAGKLPEPESEAGALQPQRVPPPAAPSVQIAPVPASDPAPLAADTSKAKTAPPKPAPAASDATPSGASGGGAAPGGVAPGKATPAPGNATPGNAAPLGAAQGGAAPGNARPEPSGAAPPAVDGPGETEAARKKRLRDLVGLPKTN